MDVLHDDDTGARPFADGAIEHYPDCALDGCEHGDNPYRLSAYGEIDLSAPIPLYRTDDPDEGLDFS